MLNRNSKKKICFVAVAEISVKVFLIDHFKSLSPFFDISVCLNTNDGTFLRSYGVDVTVIPMQIERKISPLSDMKTLFCLYGLFRKYKFDVVHSIMPKSGLLSMIAAFFAQIPLRIHTFTGQVWVTRKGFVRWLLKSMDKIMAACATHILVDSHSQRNFLTGQAVVSPDKSSVIAEGSICGVDTERFSPNVEARDQIRRQYGVSESDTIFLYLGRLNHDKGLLDLARAFANVDSIYNAHLVIVGPDEENMKEKMLELCSGCSHRIHFEVYTDKPERFMAAADVFCLPSYREGFGMTIIEAASVGIPSIGTRIYGITDAIEENITGFLYGPGDIEELATKMLFMIEMADIRKKMGRQSRERVLQSYSKEHVTTAFFNFYNTLFALK